MNIGPALERRLPGILRLTEIVLGVATIGLIAYLLANEIDPGLLRPAAQPTRMAAVRAQAPPRVIRVMSDRTVSIPAGEHLDTTFVVRDPRPCELTGSVAGMQGGDRDIEVYLLGQNAYDDWHNGVAPRPIYFGGRASEVSLHVPIPGPGRYYFLISNRYSIFTDKRVAVRNLRVTCATPDVPDLHTNGS